VDQAGVTHITTDLALAWATLPANVQPADWARRLGIARSFARFCSARDPRTIVPPLGLLPYRYQRPAPYIYRDDEIVRLLEAARQLSSPTGLRPHTYATLFGLYAVTGMRCNEPLQLDRTDVDLANGVLTIRGTKFGKSRYVPLHASTQQALKDYATCRDRLCGAPDSPSFFVSEHGSRLTKWSVRRTFVTLSHQIGLRKAGDSRGPRLHDLRHRMAVIRSCAGIATASMSSDTCPSSRPTSDTYISSTPTGISQRRRSCCSTLLRVEQSELGILP
jgi:site-specific recombinase XerD